MAKFDGVSEFGTSSFGGNLVRSDSRRLPLQTRVAPIYDVMAWLIALFAATSFRYHIFETLPFSRRDFLLGVVVALATQLTIGSVIVYRNRWRIGSFEEVLATSTVYLSTGAVLLLASLAGLRRGLSLGDVFAATMFALTFAFSGRALYRVRYARGHRPMPDAGAPRALLYGAGDAGSQLLDALFALAHPPYHPVAFLDDNPSKRNLRIRNLSVVGGRSELARAAQRFNATFVLITIANVGASAVNEISTLARETGLDVRIVPAYSETLFGEIRAQDLREVTVEDVMGRREVETDFGAVDELVRDRRVLVTGAGGSIGSELCRQLSRYSPSTLVLLDRDESGLHATQMSIEGRALLDQRTLVVCDIRDADALESVFSEHEPEIVIHAAALKHLPLLEMWPGEAVKTNIEGTLNILETSRRHRVETFVNISTDKAADPTSVLGYTKRIAERLCASYDSGNFLSVRFGNVLGSRGSFLPAFQKQLEDGGPITVTHPDVTRYFMTISEAVQLTLQAAALGQSGNVLILEMGEPVRILDVANRLNEEARMPVKIVFTGLRPGEKIEEVLFGSNETVVERIHPSIMSAPVPALLPSQCRGIASGLRHDFIVERLRALCVTTDGSEESDGMSDSTELQLSSDDLRMTDSV